MKIQVSVILEPIDYPGDETPSHYELCDACRQRLHEAMEDAIIEYTNGRQANVLGSEVQVFTGKINRYELVCNAVHLRKRYASTPTEGKHRSDELLPRDWISSKER